MRKLDRLFMSDENCIWVRAFRFAPKDRVNDATGFIAILTEKTPDHLTGEPTFRLIALGEL